MTATNNPPKRLVTFETATASDSSDADRDRWPSRAAFYLAAVGSAVGFGNIWRFPALAKDYGGGAFFVPYLMALILVGLPVLILEIGFGQYHQTGNIGVFGSFHARLRGVGMGSVSLAFMLVVYYSMLLAWVARAFFESWSDDAPWTDEDVNGTTAVGYFTGHIIGMETLGGDLRPTRIVAPNVGYSFFVWLCIWASLAFGLKWTGRIAYISMGLPILLLFMFLIRACTLEGASDGIKAYIGEWDMEVLTERPDVWSTAVSQIFFSLSVTFGTMTAYGSHCPRGEPVFTNSVVVGFANSMFSILSGFAVFAAIGHLAYQEGVAVDKVSYAGFSLVFGTWPVVLGSLPGGGFWARLLFVDLFLLGIDSAFSIVEAPLTVATDRHGWDKIPKWKVAGGFCTAGFLLSIIYATDAGLIFLDTVDFYINFILLLVGFFETFGAGWVFNIERTIEQLGPEVVLVYIFTNFGSVIIASGLWFGLNENAVMAGFVALFGSIALGLAITFALLAKRMNEEPGKWTWNSIIYELCLKNVIDLRDELSEVVGYMPWVWAFAMKSIIPHILLILFINLTQSSNGSGAPLFGNYEGYVSWPFQILGILCVAFAASLILVGAAMPVLFESFDIPFVEAQERATKEASEVDITERGLQKHDESSEEEQIEA